MEEITLTKEEAEEYKHNLEIYSIKREIEEVRYEAKHNLFFMAFCLAFLYFIVTVLPNYKSDFPDKFWESYDMSHSDGNGRGY